MSIIAPQDFAFYADESGISRDRFTVVGGICMHRSTAEAVYASIDRYREQYNMRSELKWSKISNQRQAEYEAFIDLFFALNNTNHIQFHCVIFDSHQWNHARYNGSDADIGLSKLYYNLILHKFIKRCGVDDEKRNELFVCLDHRTSSTSLHDLRNMLNATAARDLNMTHRPIRQLVSRDSKKDNLLQLNDVILGAVCASRNGKHLLAEARPSKRAIANLVLERSGHRRFDRDSPFGVDRFTVWNFRARPR
ncbi:MAG: DUF3800 domain-containing protein [Pseudomonadota bacterium]